VVQPFVWPGVVRRKGHAAKFDLLSIADDAIGLDGLVIQIIAIVEGAIVSVVVFATTHHLLSVEFADHDGRTGFAPELSEAAAMIDVRLGVQQNLHVLDPKAQLFDVGFHLRQQLNVPGVDQDVTCRCRDEE